MMSTLDRLKLRLGISGTDEDALLELLISDAEEYAINYCNLSDTSDIPEKLYSTIVDMAILAYNRMGGEGLKSESYAGASYSYDTEYPDSIKRALQRERLAVVS